MERKQVNQTESNAYTQFHKPGSGERKRREALRKIEEAKMNLKKNR